MKKKMNICETPIPECELDTYEAVAYEEQFTFDDLKNVLTSNEIKMLRQHFIEGYSIKEISIANSMKIGTGTMKFSRMYKKIKNFFIFIKCPLCLFIIYYIIFKGSLS